MRRMQFAALALVPVLVVGCSGTTSIAVDDLTGTWNATQFQFTNTANPAQTVDLITLGATFTLNILADGDYTATVQEPGELTETLVGTLTVSGDAITIAESGQGSPTLFTAARSGNTLTLTTTDEEFDFDEDDIEEPASLRMVLQKM